MAQPQIAIRTLQPGDAGWVIMQHGAIYAAEENYDSSFEALVARIVADFLDSNDPKVEAGWIAEAEGIRLGCIFCVRVDQTTAKLRLFLTVPEARGRGLGRQLLAHCMAFARSKGYRRMVLWTHESHKAACALYAATGWRMVASSPGHQFGVDVVDQEWEVDLF